MTEAREMMHCLKFRTDESGIRNAYRYNSWILGNVPNTLINFPIEFGWRFEFANDMSKLCHISA